MISEISRAASLTELTSNPKSFFNCPDLHGGVPRLPGGRFRSGKIAFLMPLANTKRCESPSARGVQRMPRRSPSRLVSARRSGLIG